MALEKRGHGGMDMWLHLLCTQASWKDVHGGANPIMLTSVGM